MPKDKLKDFSTTGGPEEMRDEYLNSITTSSETPVFTLDDFKANFGESFFYKVVEEGDKYAKGGINKKKHVGKRVVVGYVPPITSTTTVGGVPTTTTSYDPTKVVMLGYFPIDEDGNGPKTEKLLSFLTHMYGEFASDTFKMEMSKNLRNELVDAGIRHNLTDLEDEIQNQIVNNNDPAGRMANTTADLNKANAKQSALIASHRNKLNALQKLLATEIGKSDQKLVEINIKLHKEKLDDIIAKMQDIIDELDAGTLDKATQIVLRNKYEVLKVEAEDLSDLIEDDLEELAKIQAAGGTSSGSGSGSTGSGSSGGGSSGTSGSSSSTAPPAAPSPTAGRGSVGSATAGTAAGAAAPVTPAGAGTPASGPALSGTASTGPTMVVFPIVSDRGPLSYKAYLEKVGVPKVHLDKVEDYGGFMRKKGSKKLKDAAKKYEKLLKRAQEIQDIYVSDPTLAGYEPWGLATGGISHKNAKKIAKLVKDMEKIESGIIKDLDSMKGKGVTSWKPDLVGNAFWTDALMAKTYDPSIWSAKSGALSYPSGAPRGSVDKLGNSQTAHPKQIEYIVGMEEFIEVIDLKNMSIDGLATMYTNVESDWRHMDELRKVLAIKLLTYGKYLPEYHNYTIVVKHEDIWDAVQILGGSDKVWEIIGEGLMTEEFQKDLNAKYTHWKSNAAFLQKEQYKGSDKYIDYFGFPDPSTDDAILANAFASTLSKEEGIGCTEIANMISSMEEGNGVIDAGIVANQVRTYANLVDLGNATKGEVFMDQGLVGWGEMIANDLGVNDSVKKGISTTLEVGMGLGSLVLKGGAIYQGAHAIGNVFKAAWKLVTWDIPGMKSALKAAGGRGLKSAGFLALESGVGFIKDPNGWSENNWAAGILGRSRKKLDPNGYGADQIKIQELNDGLIYSGSAYTKMARDALGNTNVSNLISNGTIKKGLNDGIIIDVENFVNREPRLKRRGVTSQEQKEVTNKVAQKLMQEYPFSRSEISAIPAGVTLQQYMDSFKTVNNQLTILSGALVGTGIVLKNAADVMRMTTAEQQKYYEKVAFAAQQSNKLLRGTSFKDTMKEFYKPATTIRYFIPGSTGSAHMAFDTFYNKIVNPALLAKDNAGVSGRQALSKALTDVIDATNPDIAIKKYYRIAAAILGGNNKFPAMDTTTTPPTPQKLYFDGALKFADYLHDPKIGNFSATTGIEYFTGATLGTGANATAAATFDTASQTWDSL